MLSAESIVTLRLRLSTAETDNLTESGLRDLLVSVRKTVYELLDERDSLLKNKDEGFAEGARAGLEETRRCFYFGPRPAEATASEPRRESVLRTCESCGYFFDHLAVCKCGRRVTTTPLASADPSKDRSRGTALDLDELERDMRGERDFRDHNWEWNARNRLVRAAPELIRRARAEEEGARVIVELGRRCAEAERERDEARLAINLDHGNTRTKLREACDERDELAKALRYIEGNFGDHREVARAALAKVGGVA